MIRTNGTIPVIHLVSGGFRLDSARKTGKQASASFADFDDYGINSGGLLYAGLSAGLYAYSFLWHWHGVMESLVALELSDYD